MQFSNGERLLLAVAIWCASSAALAQEPTRAPTPVPTPTIVPLQFQEVVQVEGATRDQLYDAALAWFPSTFKSGKDVLQIQNKEAEMLVGTGVEPCTYGRHILLSIFPEHGLIRYHITVEMKDGRYRVTVDGFVHEGIGRSLSFGPLTTAPNPPPETVGQWWPKHLSEAWRQFKTQARVTAKGLTESLHAKLATAATEKPW